MPESIAFAEFKDSLIMAEELLKIEKSYNNPPRLNEQKPVQGLRGAVAILVVASFEQFLKQAIEEHLSRLTIHPSVQFSVLPDAMQVCHVYNTLERAMKGPLFEEPLPRKDRIVDIEMACKKILSGIVNPSAFIVTGGNPTSKTIRSMTKDLGISNIFDKVRHGFIRKWKKPIAQTFIQDKWDGIVNRRHIVAHTANALNITRNQLKESIRFSKIFAEQIDNQIRDHTNSIFHSSAHH